MIMIKKRFVLIILLLLSLVACGPKDNQKNEIALLYPIELEYAEQFSGEYYENGYIHIHVEDGSDYVLVPEGAGEQSLGLDNPTYIHLPVNNIYLAATSAMDMFNSLGEVDRIGFVSTKADDYSIDNVKEKIEHDEIKYIGKYSAPDYESLMASGCQMALESTMIYHSPKIKEELESLGIPVFVEKSSYEKNPLGRLEWIKLYGILTGKEELAKEFYQKEKDKISDLMDELKDNSIENTNTAVFYITSAGLINIKKPGDYFVRMIEIAGGSYAFDGIVEEEENALSTMNIGWEDFYINAKDADILIYNGTIDGGIKTIDELIEKNDLMKDFKAVKTGQVYCLGVDMFQQTSKTADVINELNEMYTNKEREEKYLIKLYEK